MNQSGGKLDTPFLLERLMREARRSLDDRDFSSEDEFRDTLREFIDEGLQERRTASLSEDPLEMAQELAYLAYESTTADEALERTEQALELDPECVDALTVHGFLTSETAAELIGALEHALTCGETRLGEEFFAEFMGDFWPMVEARPYLRTIKQLGQVLWSVGRRFDAVENYRNLLDLDPSDHMGSSTLLLGRYLSMGEVQYSWDLLEEYDDGENAVYQWAWVLVQLLADDEDAAADALEHALAVNAYVVDHLFGLVPEDDENPPYVAAGSPAEAALCGQILGEAWERNPDAHLWLHSQLVQLGLIEPLNDRNIEFELEDEEPSAPDETDKPTRH